MCFGAVHASRKLLSAYRYIFPTKNMMSPMENEVKDGGMVEGVKGIKRKISLSNCGICGSKESKYRCPACLTRSCSLQCVKTHKKDSGCTGVRNKTAFVSIAQFDEMALLSDYRFLEDTGRYADGTSRDDLLRTPRITMKAKKLAASARKMCITLKFLPVAFTKSRENSTLFLRNEQIFLWHLKLVFPQSNADFIQKRVSDRQTLEEILTSYIHPTKSDPVTRQKLKMYVQAPFDDMKVFMKAVGRKANSVRYHELDIQKSLRDNLSYKTVIEYPVLHIVLRANWKDYPLKGPAEPASGYGFAMKSKRPRHEEEDITQVSPLLQGPSILGGSNTLSVTPKTSPNSEPLQEKGEKREVEEGEITNSSDEEKEVEKEQENTM